MPGLVSDVVKNGLSRVMGRGEAVAAQDVVGKVSVDQAARAFGRDTLATQASAPVSSVIHFDAQSSFMDRLLQKLGWSKAGNQVAAMNDRTFLHYSVDGNSWKDQPLQYLHDNTQGFLLRDVAPNTPVQGAIHAEVGISHDGFYSMDTTHDEWLNTWGNNFPLTTEVNK